MADQDETLRLSGGASRERWLLVLGGPDTQSVRLPESGALTIGRSPKCDIIIADQSVSREHVRLSLGDDMRVEDLGSANGTRVAGITLPPNAPSLLAPGILVDVGNVGIMVRVGPLQAASQALSSAAVTMERVAKSSLTVLIQGETGSGKEVMAEQIHRLSPRAAEPLLRINCASIADTLMESELFGHERGAFTGAVAAKPGLFETANGGTVFLDEIGDLGLALQAKLLRVLEDRKVWRVGALKPRSLDVRFLAATHRNLEDAVQAGKFRQDLMFRLNAITLHVPPLRARIAEIEPLAREFLAEACSAMGRPLLRMDSSAVQALLRYSWPGNIRELRNVMGRAVTVCDGPDLQEAHLRLPAQVESRRFSEMPPESSPEASGRGTLGFGPASVRPPGSLHDDVDALEEQRILQALESCNYNRTKTAQLLGIARNTLAARIARFNIRVPDRD